MLVSNSEFLQTVNEKKVVYIAVKVVPLIMPTD